ncbi:MAG: WYL domain-containing protein [Bacteriovoracaceae bacterium]|jgi:hypothetical protein|nr:WYL domain-containing protein [Bacteriovoracaceae bacterium]
MRETLLENEQFWNVLRYLETMKSETPVDHILTELAIDERILFDVIYFLHLLEINFSLSSDSGKKLLVPPSKFPNIKMDLSLSEWLALQAHFPVLDGLGNTPFHSIIVQKLGKIENGHKSVDLFSALGGMTQRSKRPTIVGTVNIDQIIDGIEKSIVWKNIIEVKLKNREYLKYLPHKLVHLEGQLNLIAEDTKDQCLVNFSVPIIEKLEILDRVDYQAKFSSIEIEGFIGGIRSVTGNEIRLVLKIKNHYSGSLNPPYHFLGAPYRVTNSDGEVIWAASVEPCENLFEWLYMLGDCVEILDPSSFKEEFIEFLESKKLKSA